MLPYTHIASIVFNFFQKSAFYEIIFGKKIVEQVRSQMTIWRMLINTLNAELNPICHLLVLLGAHHILHISRIKVKCLIPKATNTTQNK